MRFFPPVPRDTPCLSIVSNKPLDLFGKIMDIIKEDGFLGCEELFDSVARGCQNKLPVSGDLGDAVRRVQFHIGTATQIERHATVTEQSLFVVPEDARFSEATENAQPI